MTKVWRPVEYGWLHLTNHELNKEYDAIEVRKSSFDTIPNNEVLLTISEQWGEREASVYLPDDLRLCALVEDDAGGVPSAEVVETIRLILAFARGNPYGDRSVINGRIDTALAWLSSLTQKGEE